MTKCKKVDKKAVTLPMRPPLKEGFYKRTGEPNEYGAICGRLAQTRKESNLTQEDFATMLGIGLSTLKSIERGYFAPTLKVIMAWNKRFKKPLEWIFYGRK